MRTLYIKLAVLTGVLLSGFGLGTPFAFADAQCPPMTGIRAYSIDINSTNFTAPLTDYVPAVVDSAHTHFESCEYPNGYGFEGFNTGALGQMFTPALTPPVLVSPVSYVLPGGTSAPPDYYAYVIQTTNHATFYGYIPFVWNGNNFNLTTPFDYNFTSSGISTTSAAQLCNTTFATSSGLLSDAAQAFSNGLCQAGVFLFAPSANALLQFNDLASSTSTRFPFSYVTSAAQTWSGLVASTTQNSPVFVVGLHDLGIGSTTALGNFLPNFTALSSSTVEHYFPPGVFDTMKGLMSIVIVLGLVSDIFFTSRNLMQ